jgi:drug/metabolite transporter (DMT)-like permease
MTASGSTPARVRQLRIGFACALIVLLMWTGFILLSRAGARGTLTPFDLAALRFGFAGAVMLPWFLVRGRGALSWGRFAAIGTIAGFGYALFAYSGFAFAPAAHGAVLLPGALPFSTAIAAWVILGERVTRQRAGGLALILAGIVLVGLQSLSDTTADSWKGDLMFVVASSCWAVYAVLARRWRVHPVDATMAASIFTAALYLPVWLAILPSNLEATPLSEILFQGVYQGIGAVVIAMIAYTQVVATFGPTRTALITAVVPGLSALLAVPVLGEPLSWLTVAGLLTVTAGMLVGLASGMGKSIRPAGAAG